MLVRYCGFWSSGNLHPWRVHTTGGAANCGSSKFSTSSPVNSLHLRPFKLALSSRHRNTGVGVTSVWALTPPMVTSYVATPFKETASPNWWRRVDARSQVRAGLHSLATVFGLGPDWSDELRDDNGWPRSSSTGAACMSAGPRTARHPSILSGAMRFVPYASSAVKARPRLTSSSRSAADQ